MRVHTYSQFDSLSYTTKNLLNRMQSPLCGMDHEIGFLLHSSRDAKVVVTGAEMAGVHTLLNLPHPGLGAYHLGGCGIRFNEAIIRTLGETVERYSQVISEVAGFSDSRFLSYQQMILLSDKVLSLDKINYFLSQQYYQQNFPFDVMTSDLPVTWVKLYSLLDRYYIWVPAQLVFVGYKVKRRQQEPWIAAAVTTGTAAHTDQAQALINAIMELIQIDSAMGHWYSSQAALKIEFDERTQSLASLMLKYNAKHYSAYTFHWLKNPDLPGFSIACIYRGFDQVLPNVVVGLGSSLQLVDAMYKAFLEAVGIMGLARMIIFDRKYHLSDNAINPRAIYDLDSNVAYYALGHKRELMDKKFPLDMTIKANDLPADIALAGEDAINLLLNSFDKSYKQLLFYDLTNTEARELGFVVPRVWSPDLLPLCLPSAPFLNHDRYLAYGGASHENPHPYP
jgi:thiazole/oxazole-forming peptide maturase SagD family component